MLVAYPLSAGPAYKLTMTGYINFRTFRTIYAPLVWVSEHVPNPVASMLLWSFHWCRYDAEFGSFPPLAPGRFTQRPGTRSIVQIDPQRMQCVAGLFKLLAQRV